MGQDVNKKIKSGEGATYAVYVIVFTCLQIKVIFQIHKDSIIIFKNRDEFTFYFANSLLIHYLLSEFIICGYFFIINILALSHIQYLIHEFILNSFYVW